MTGHLFRDPDRTRTGDVQLGKLAFYQLNYARMPNALYTTTRNTGSRKSQRSGLNRRPPDYESGALPLSYAGGDWPIPRGLAPCLCPGADSNRYAFRHHPLKMACLPISPPGPYGYCYSYTGLTGLEPATSGVTVRHSNQLSYSPNYTTTSHHNAQSRTNHNTGTTS